MRLSVFGVADQKSALKQLAELAQRSVVHPRVREAAIAITSDCHSRDDDCELEAIFAAIKPVELGGTGTKKVPGLVKGVRYLADPRWADSFTAPHRLLEQAQRLGAIAGDCDDHSALIAALAGSLGFAVGLRVWGKTADEYVHVYTVAGLPKRSPRKVVGLDTTVEQSYVGWEPPTGAVLTAWFE